MTDEDKVMTGFFRIKSLLIEAQEEFGPELGKRVVALAAVRAKDHGITTTQAYYGLLDEVRRELLGSTTIEIGEPE